MSRCPSTWAFSAGILAVAIAAAGLLPTTPARAETWEYPSGTYKADWK